jgi:hypothetical protein
MTWFKCGRKVFLLEQIASIEENRDKPPRCTVRLVDGDKIKLGETAYETLKSHLGTVVVLDEDTSPESPTHQPDSGTPSMDAENPAQWTRLR